MFYKVLRFVLQIIFGILFRPKILGKENVPMTGGMIMAANHLSNWDPPMVGTYMPRPVAYMAKEELFKPAIAGAVISNLYAFPVKRGAADRAAIKTALGILKQGLCLGVFPEGHRSMMPKKMAPTLGWSRRFTLLPMARFTASTFSSVPVTRMRSPTCSWFRYPSDAILATGPAGDRC